MEGCPFLFQNGSNYSRHFASFLLKAKRPVHLDILSQPVFSVLGPLSESPQHMASLDCRAPNAVSRGFGLCLCGSFAFFSSSAGCVVPV